MDWTQVQAADLFVMLSSVLPKGGQFLSVSVHPSEFGLKRMEEEAIRGPIALFYGEEASKDKDTDSDGDDDEIDNEKLRAYEKVDSGALGGGHCISRPGQWACGHATSRRNALPREIR